MSLFEYTDEISLSEVSKACLIGATETVKELLLSGKCPSVRDNQGRTSIHLAAEKGHLECCKLLLDREDTNVNITSYDGVSPLMMAASSGHLDLVKMFVSMGADTELMDSTGSSCLDRALSTNNFRMFEYLLTVTDPNIHSFEGWTISHTCAKEDKQDFLHLLRNDRRCRFTPTDSGVTPLHLACKEGNIECVRLLVEYEPALLEHKAEDGATGIFLAAHNEHPGVVQYMIDMGADVDVMSKDGTVVHSAVLGGAPLSLEILLYNGADPNGAREKARSLDVETPLYLATFWGDERCVGILLEYGALVYAEEEMIVEDALEQFIFLPYSASVDELDNYSASETLWALANAVRQTPAQLCKALERCSPYSTLLHHLYNIIRTVKWPLRKLITPTFVNKIIYYSHVRTLSMLITKNYRFSQKVVGINLNRYFKYSTIERDHIHLIHRALFDQQVLVSTKFRDFLFRYYNSTMDANRRDLLSLVDKYSKTPRPLVEFCRFKIRRMIWWTVDVDVVINQLPIPEIYKEILLFERNSLVSPAYLRTLGENESLGL